jgi:hypothetical protein
MPAAPTLQFAAVDLEHKRPAVVLLQQAQAYTHLDVGGLQQQPVSTLCQTHGTRGGVSWCSKYAQ